MGKKRKSYEIILKKYFGYDNLKNEQYTIIESIIHKNKDVCAILATGFGKSLCYQLPYLITKKNVIVISPLLSLMQDQATDLQSKNIPVCCLNSDNSTKHKDIQKILDGNSHIIFMTPEFFSLSEDFITELDDMDDLACIAVDESHCISTWSDASFRPKYKELKCIRDWTDDIPILTLTATANDKIKKDTIKILKLNDPLVIQGSFDRKNLKFHVASKDKTNKYYDVLEVAKRFKNDFIIVYAKTREETEKIAKYLTKNKIKANPYHAGFDKEKKNKIQKDFMSGKIKCIVATIAFGMGINNKHVRLVVHYGCPQNLDSYYQEVGRAGRDGTDSECHMFYSDRDFYLSGLFASKNKSESKRTYAQKQLKCIKDFVYATTCRRALILKHFGESVDYKKCNNCDNCLDKEKTPTQDLTAEFKLIIGLVTTLERNYGSTMIINILRGSNAKKVLSFMKKLPQFGKGKEYKVQWWKDFIRVLVINKYLVEKTFSSRFSATVIEATKEAINTLKKKKEVILPISKYMKDNTSISKKKYDDIVSEHFPHLNSI